MRPQRIVQSSKKLILFVDDSIDMLQLGRAVLEGEGYEVFTASGGTQALELLSTIKAPNLLILDLQLEDMNGYDFLKLLEDRWPELIKEVPVVFYTATQTVSASKAKGVIAKSGDLENFIESVHSYIELGQTAVEKSREAATFEEPSRLMIH